MKQLDEARIGIAAQAVGIAQAAFEVAVKYAATRQSFGLPLNQFQAVKVTLITLYNGKSIYQFFFRLD